MSGYFCIGFIDFRSKGKNLLNYTNLYKFVLTNNVLKEHKEVKEEI